MAAFEPQLRQQMDSSPGDEISDAAAAGDAGVERIRGAAAQNREGSALLKLATAYSHQNCDEVSAPRFKKVEGKAHKQVNDEKRAGLDRQRLKVEEISQRSPEDYFTHRGRKRRVKLVSHTVVLGFCMGDRYAISSDSRRTFSKDTARLMERDKQEVRYHSNNQPYADQGTKIFQLKHYPNVSVGVSGKGGPTTTLIIELNALHQGLSFEQITDAVLHGCNKLNLDALVGGYHKGEAQLCKIQGGRLHRTNVAGVGSGGAAGELWLRTQSKLNITMSDIEMVREIEAATRVGIDSDRIQCGGKVWIDMYGYTNYRNFKPEKGGGVVISISDVRKNNVKKEGRRRR